METLLSLTSETLVQRTRALVREELRIGLEVLAHLREIERRRLYAERGHASLFSFCTRELGYSEPQAQLRIDAMRALRDTPQIEEKVRSGALPVTAVVKVQQFLRRERARTGETYPQAARAELFTRMEGRSTREIERELMTISPASTLPVERERVISESHSELRLVISEALREKLERLKAIYGHRMGDDPNSTAKLLDILAGDALKRAEGKGPGTEGQPLTSGAEESESAQSGAMPSRMPDSVVAPIAPKVYGRSRFIPLRVRRAVWSRDQGRCRYRDPGTGQRCDSRRYLQIDHLIPFSRGGATQDPARLRLLCGRHNRLEWEKWKAAGPEVGPRKACARIDDQGLA